MDLVQSNCGLSSMALPFTLCVLSILSLCFMLFYTIIHYLAQQIDHLIFPDERPVSHGLSVHRRRLLEIRAAPIFKAIFWTLTVLLLLGTSAFLVVFILFTTLAACVAPERLLPVLLAIVAVALVARNTYVSLRKLQDALESRLKDIHKNLNSAIEIDEAVEGVMREMGFNSTQILLITLAVCIVFAAVVAFVLLGCLLFMTVSSIIPTLISSGMVVLSAGATLQAGEVSPDYTSKIKLTDKLNKQLAEANQFSSVSANFLTAESGEAQLQSAAKLSTQAGLAPKTTK